MIEIKTLKIWVEELGLRVKGESTADILQVALPALNAPVFTIKSERTDWWQITHQRRIAGSKVNSEWEIGGEPSEPPITRLTIAVQHLATGFPLLSVHVSRSEPNVVIEFKAPIHGDGLSRQAFMLTVSSIVKSVEAFDALSAHRVRQIQVLKELKAEEDALREKYEVSPVAASSASAPPKKIMLSRRCPRCNQVVGAGKTSCDACGTSL